MGKNIVEKDVFGLVEREEHDTLQGVAKLSSDEIAVLKYKQNVRERISELESQIENTKTRDYKRFVMLFLVGALGGLAVSMIPLKTIVDVALETPFVFKFFIGFFAASSIARLVIAFFIREKAKAFFRGRNERMKILEQDLALVFRVFEPAQITELNAEFLTATQIIKRVYQKTGQELNARSLGRKLKRAFRQTKSRKYIVKRR